MAVLCSTRAETSQQALDNLAACSSPERSVFGAVRAEEEGGKLSFYTQYLGHMLLFFFSCGRTCTKMQRMAYIRLEQALIVDVFFHPSCIRGGEDG